MSKTEEVKILPKKDKEGKFYLSYSQYTKFLDSVREYIRRYMLGEPEPSNKHFEFGKLIGGALETGDFSEFTKEEQKLLKTIPRHDEFEKEIRLDMGWFYVLGYIDTNTLNEKGEVDLIIDYKTGAEDKKEVYESDDYKQMYIYAEALKQKQGYLPKAQVILIEKLSDGSGFNADLFLGNKTWTIDKDIKSKHIEDTLSLINDTADEISEYTRVFNHLKNISLWN